MKFIAFVVEIIKRVKENDLISMANALTYKLIISIFPFIIFLMTLIGFLDIDISGYVFDITRDIPVQVQDIFHTFIEEVFETKQIAILSVSLLIYIYTASSGFHSFIKGLNRAYGVKEKRGFFFTRLISFFLVVLFTFSIILSIYILILTDVINSIIISYSMLKEIPTILKSAWLNVIMVIIMYFTIVLVYRLGADIKVKLVQILPGAIFTASSWLILSKCFNIYVNNFDRFSVVYGSIGGLFVFMFWLNLLSYVVLIGCQINAVLGDKIYMQNLLHKH